ncbi:uncharacterized protein LOC111051406 [Nilaparvata lugens]|uniref:uncharacterized protein LOC111051406 n=1 Tax=Nilaparvata lugens TaxID=108931 RepID=UPI00193CD505|nr:uncharacterized protein LOC111051406 [Nilaparvata lugens]
MVHPGDNVLSQRSSRDHVDEGYSTPPRQSFIIPVMERRGSSDHMQPSMPSPGEIRAMFGTSRICEYPEYQRASSIVPDPVEWSADTHLDDLEEKLIKIRQWSEATSSRQQDAFTEIGRRDASHRLVQNAPPEVLFGADFGVPRGSRFYRAECCSNRSFTGTVSESDDLSSTNSQSGLPNHYLHEDGVRGYPNRRGSSIFTLNDDSRSLTSDERMVKYLLDKDVMNIEGTSLSKAKSLSKLCDIVQSLRRVYEDNKKACHVVKKLLQIFNVNDEVNGKLEGDTKTILKEKFCKFLENSEPELDAYKDINKLFDLLEFGLTADEESTLQSTLENLCVKLNPELNCLQYEAQPVLKSCVPSERELLTNEEDEVLIKLHNLSSDLSVTVLEEIDGKTSVVGQSLPKKNSFDRSNTCKKPVTNIPVNLSRGSSFQSNHTSTRVQQVASSESNTSAASKQSMTSGRRNFGAFKEDLFRKAIALGFTKDVEELEKSAGSLSRRSQLALLERKVSGRYKSMQIAEERRKIGAPERIAINNKPLGRCRPGSSDVKKGRVSSPTSSQNLSNVSNVSKASNMSTTLLRPRTSSNLEVEEKMSPRKLGVKSSNNRRKIVLDIIPVLRKNKSKDDDMVEAVERVTLPETISCSPVDEDNDEVYSKSNPCFEEQRGESSSDDQIRTLSDATEQISEATSDDTELDTQIDNECSVRKTGSKNSNNNRRKTIHAIVTVSCGLPEKSQEVLSEGEKVGDEVNKNESSFLQSSPLESNRSSTLIMRSENAEPTVITDPTVSTEPTTIISGVEVDEPNDSESIVPDEDQESPKSENQRIPVCSRKKDHYMGSIFLIFFTVALLYSVFLYGNFEFCHDKYDYYQKVMVEFMGVIRNNIHDFKEKCCQIFAKSIN